MDGVDDQEDTPRKQTLMGSSGTGNALQIYCRLRPAEKSVSNETEDEAKQAEDVATLERKSDTTLALRRPNSLLEQQYLFEHVFDGDASQQSVFERAAMPLIESLLVGQDGLIFAYGATGSGKSFTVSGQPDKPGIVPCTIDYLFEVLASRLNVECHIQPDNQNHYIVNHRFSSGKFIFALEETGTSDDSEKQLVGEWTKRVRNKKTSQLSPATMEHISTRRYDVFVSFVEIYNNYIYDLLEQPDPSAINWRRAPHQLRQDTRKTVFVYGASEVPAKNADQAMRLFLYGLQNRQTAATRLNQCSSRSHSVFTLKVVSYDEAQLGEQLLNENQLTVNQFSIVDLAGVERTSRTKVTGAMLAETNSINNSLLTLRNCFEIMRANQAAKKPKPIPFRTHKLTFLLKSFFERRSSLIRMIICVKPAIEDMNDNIQVLGFGQKAQEIVIERQVPNTAESRTEEKKESRTGSAGQMQFALTRFQGNLLDEQQLEDGNFDSAKFIQEMEQYLEAHKRESEAMLRLSLQTVQELSDNLKFYPERQALRRSKPVAGYSLKLTGLVTTKLLPLYQGKSGRQSSCCLHRLSSIAGAPLVVPRQPGPTLIDRSKELALQELRRELSSWESALIDTKGKLNGQVRDLRLYIDKVVLKVAPSHPRGKLDVFTRLYSQTPTRYKVKAITGQAAAKSSSRLVSTSKVSQLKRLFIRPEPAKVTIPSGSGRKMPVMSSKIKSLCNQLTARDSNLVSKLASSAGRNGNPAAPKSRRNLTKTKMF